MSTSRKIEEENSWVGEKIRPGSQNGKEKAESSSLFLLKWLRKKGDPKERQCSNVDDKQKRSRSEGKAQSSCRCMKTNKWGDKKFLKGSGKTFVSDLSLGPYDTERELKYKKRCPIPGSRRREWPKPRSLAKEGKGQRCGSWLPKAVQFWIKREALIWRRRVTKWKRSSC